MASLQFAACGGEEPAAYGERPSSTNNDKALIITSNYPLYFFAERIARDVNAAPRIVLPDFEGDPAFWIPTSEQIQLLQSADVVLLNGAGAESWLDLITIDQRRLVDTSADIAARLIPLEDSVLHQHGPGGEHSHQGNAFTIWLDPQLAIAQANSVADVLIELAPSGKSKFQSNLTKLEQDLTQLDKQIADVFATLDDRPVLFSHPVYQYLKHHYGINGQSVHWEPDQEPTTSAWIELQQLLGAHPATIMIWEDEPLASTDGRLSDAGIKSVVFRPVANRPPDGDYLSIMRANSERLASSLQ